MLFQCYSNPIPMLFHKKEDQPKEKLLQTTFAHFPGKCQRYRLENQRKRKRKRGSHCEWGEKKDWLFHG